MWGFCGGWHVLIHNSPDTVNSRIGFTAQAALGTVGASDLNHAHSGVRHDPGKLRAIETGALDANCVGDTVGVEEADDFAVATSY